MKSVALTKGKFAIVDDADYGAVGAFKWYCLEIKHKWSPTTYYAARRIHPGRGGVVLMHRVIMGLERIDRRTVDHIDNNGLNNTRSNMRVATRQQNNQHNRWHKTPRSSSRFKGVHYTRMKGGCGVLSKPWAARISLNGRHVFIGRFATENEAAIAYDERARELHGEFATPNFPGDEGRACIHKETTHVN